MPKQIFDQDRPRSAMAQRLDDAFAGCEEWTVAPPSRKRGLEVAPWLGTSASGPADYEDDFEADLPHAA